ncbi:MAG: hypothetical protein KJ954_14435, partial [Alphaproteobacteria bacterium]|nr:hypothetical protein [Alphaproteobacteria bacterium]
MNPDQRQNLIKLIKWISDPLEFRKLVKISDEHKGAIPYEPWGHLLRLVYLKRKYRYVVVGKAKKQGVSTEFGIDALNLAMTRPGWKHRFISKGEAEGVRQLLDPAKFAYMHFPKEIQELVVPDKWNDTEIRFPLLNSSIIVLSGTSTGAVGEAASEVDIDEMDFQEDPHRAWVTAEAATMYGGRACLSSTRWIADPTQSEWLQTYLGARDGTNNFKKIFIGCFSRPMESQEEWREYQQKNYASSESGLFEWNYPKTEED